MGELVLNNYYLFLEVEFSEPFCLVKENHTSALCSTISWVAEVPGHTHHHKDLNTPWNASTIQDKSS